MSIPKEPRQLMINLMYLVLTAMLALNVSAEIINAFFVVDKGIKKSNDIVNVANEAIIKSIAKQVEAYPEYEIFEKKAGEAHDIAKDFYTYVQGIRDEIIEAAGGIDPETDKPKDKKNKDVTTRILVDGPEAKGNGKGYELEKKIIETRKKFIALLDGLDKNPELGIKKQDARSVIPQAKSTRMVVSGPVYAWRHFIWLRALDKAAQKHIRTVGQGILELMTQINPELWKDENLEFNRNKGMLTK